MVKGRSLKDALDQLRANPRQAEKEYSLGRLLSILVNVCHALAYAHARGVIHRDLKPANIMLGDFGEVYVMDWGLAKVLNQPTLTALESATAPPFAQVATPGSPARSSQVVTSREPEADLTQEGSVLGTPGYMPPEQASGQMQAIDQRSDVYSLGAMLYEMLTLQMPVDKEGGQLAVLMRVAQGEIIPPEERAPERARLGKIPKELSAIAWKALATEPGARYPTVEAFRKDIERFQEGRSVSAKHDTTGEILWKLVKRNKAVSAALSVLVPILVVLLGAAFINYAVAKRNETELVSRTREAVPALVVAARQVANAGNLDGARKQVELALAYEPKDADAHLLKAQILLGKKDWATARAELELYLQQKNDADVRKLLELSSTGKVDDAATQFAVAEVLSRQNVPGAAIPLLTEVAAEKKKREAVLVVYHKKIESNWPGLGKRMHLEDNGQFSLNLRDCKQVTLEPLQGMQVNKLDLLGCNQIKDLTPLKSMPLTHLTLTSCNQVADLKPLEGMKLTWLDLRGCALVRDLTPLKGMPLTSLNLWHLVLVKDLRPLQGMPLKELYLNYAYELEDLTPLQGMPLTRLNLGSCGRVKDLTPLKGMPLAELSMNGCRTVPDLAPLRGMPLTSLYLESCDRVKDLTPLEGMKLIELTLTPKNIAKGMEVVRQMNSLKTIRVNDQNSFAPAEFWRRYDAGEFNK
jgi:hypothetical protein